MTVISGAVGVIGSAVAGGGTEDIPTNTSHARESDEPNEAVADKGGDPFAG